MLSCSFTAKSPIPRSGNSAGEQMAVVIQASVVEEHGGVQCHSSQTCIAKDIIKVMTWGDTKVALKHNPYKRDHTELTQKTAKTCGNAL